MKAIKTESLTKTYRVKIKEEGLKASLEGIINPTWNEVVAVREISLEVEKGEMVAFIGPNGAGKSTFIKMLCGILHPTAGDVSVMGMSPTKQRKEVAMKIGAVFGQKSQLWAHLPVLDNFKLLSAIYEINDSEYKKRVTELIDLFGLSEILKTPIRKLSLGQRIRCEVAASFLHNPEILFLDEPTIGLDIVVKQTIRDLILRLNKEKGTTVFLTSHDPMDIEYLCKRVVIIDEGSIILDSSVEGMRKDYLRKKKVEVNFGENQEIPQIDGVKVIEQDNNKQYVMEVDTEKCQIGHVISRLSSISNLLDINVANPPMEDIISAIYKRKEV